MTAHDRPSSTHSSSSDVKLSHEPIEDDASSSSPSSQPRHGETVDRIVAKGPDAERLARQYRETIIRHSRLNPDNVPSPWSRAVLLLFVVVLFWYALQTRLRVIEWKRSLDAPNAEEWDKDYTNVELLPNVRGLVGVNEQLLNNNDRHIEL